KGQQNTSEMTTKDKELSMPASGVILAGEAVVPQHHIDFDLLLEKVKDLNLLAGEGTSHIEHKPGGARLRQPEPLPLTLYQNGIVMFNGPFRPYADPSTQQCLQDIMDGYFPSELQMRYPDGIPLQVKQCRTCSGFLSSLMDALHNRAGIYTACPTAGCILPALVH
uniref:UBX domain-containing protein 11 n=1 Tax=Melopsittacus undulatus TaxID=13146 RepID=A0A8C6N6J0_MELUD